MEANIVKALEANNFTYSAIKLGENKFLSKYLFLEILTYSNPR